MNLNIYGVLLNPHGEQLGAYEYSLPYYYIAGTLCWVIFLITISILWKRKGTLNILLNKITIAVVIVKFLLLLYSSYYYNNLKIDGQISPLLTFIYEITPILFFVIHFSYALTLSKGWNIVRSTLLHNELISASVLLISIIGIYISYSFYKHLFLQVSYIILMLTLMRYTFTSLYKTSGALYNQKRLIEFYIPSLDLGDLLKKIEFFNFIKVILLFYTIMSILHLSLNFFPYIKNHTSILVLIMELIDLCTYLSIAILLTMYSYPIELKTKIQKKDPLIEDIPTLLVIQNPPILTNEGKWIPSISLASTPKSKYGFDEKHEKQED